MAQYLESLAAVRAIRLRSIAPGHGHLIEDPKAVIDDYIEHRLVREQQILDLLVETGHVQDRRPGRGHLRRRRPRAAPRGPRTVHAHLIKLAKEGKVKGRSVDGKWSAI